MLIQFMSQGTKRRFVSSIKSHILITIRKITMSIIALSQKTRVDFGKLYISN